MLITLALFIMTYYVVCWVLWHTEYAYLTSWIQNSTKTYPDASSSNLLLIENLTKQYVTSILKKAIFMFLLLCWYLSFKFSTFFFFSVVLYRWGSWALSPFVEKYYKFYVENELEIWIIFSVGVWGVIFLETIISFTRFPTLIFSSFFGLTAIWPLYAYMGHGFYGKFNYFLSCIICWYFFKYVLKPYLVDWGVPFILSKRYAVYHKILWCAVLLFLCKWSYVCLVEWTWKHAIFEALIVFVDGV